MDDYPVFVQVVRFNYISGHEGTLTAFAIHVGRTIYVTPVTKYYFYFFSFSLSFQQLTTLLACCCRRKRFIASLLKQAGDDCILLAVRGCDAAQEALCLMLEWRLLANEEARLQIVNALESTDSGKERYVALCQRQKNLQELVSKFANRSRSNDAECRALSFRFVLYFARTNAPIKIEPRSTDPLKFRTREIFRFCGDCARVISY